MEIDTRIVKNFWTEEEIEYFENAVPKDEKYLWVDISAKTGKKVAETVNLFLHWPEFKPVADLLLPKIHKEFGDNIKIDSAHILNSYNPYGIHTDVLSGKFDLERGSDQWKEENKYAWTFLIPLENYKSSTIVFEEESPYIKTAIEWAKANGKTPDPTAIDRETRDKYFSHVSEEELDYLHIEQIYNWNKGDLFAASRAKFHTSDNYLANGIEFKRAIIIWTSIID